MSDALPQLQVMRPPRGVQMTAGWPGVSMTVLEPNGLTGIGGAEGVVVTLSPVPAVASGICGAPTA